MGSAAIKIDFLLVKNMVADFPLVVDVDQNVGAVLELLRKHRLGQAPVVDGGLYLGLITIFTLLDKVNAGGMKEDMRLLVDKSRPVLAIEDFLPDEELPREEFYPVVDEHRHFLGVVWQRQICQEKDKIFKRLKMELDGILDASYDGLLITDEHGIGIRSNNAHGRITGLPQENFVGKSIAELFNLGIFNHQSITIRALREKCRVTGMQTINGGKEVLATANPVFDSNGQVTMIVTNIRDITELNFLREELAETKALSAKYHSELCRIKGEIEEKNKIITKNMQAKKVYELAERVAESDATVLIFGESGVGKEGLAKLIHQKSHRRQTGKFVEVNCGAIPENLVESELFGYEPGAFTGANKIGKKGLFEVAHQGTLFLDEVGELPLALQVKLLRVLQEQEIYRIGGTAPIKLDVRIVAATNKNLLQKVHEKLFREDLYYRLNVVPLEIPPLRERLEDILPLIVHYTKVFNNKYQMQKTFSAKTLRILQSYSWPGNVRELINVIERLMVTSGENMIEMDQEEIISLLKLPQEISPVSVTDLMPLKEARQVVEKQLIQMALVKHKSIRKAAQALDVSHSAIIQKMAAYQLKNGHKPNH